MGIPLSNTLITIERSTLSDTDDPYEPDDYPTPSTTTVAKGIRAVIDPPTGSTNLVAGQRVTYSAKIVADPCDLQAGDTVTADDGTVWTVLWARTLAAVGIGYTEGSVRLVQGFAA